MRDASCQQCGGVIRGHRKMCFSNGYIPHSHKRMPIAERYRNKCTTPTLVSEHELRTILSTQGLIARSDLLLCHKKTATRLRQQYRCIAIERVGVGNWHWNNTPVIAMHLRPRCLRFIFDSLTHIPIHEHLPILFQQQPEQDKYLSNVGSCQ